MHEIGANEAIESSVLPLAEALSRSRRPVVLTGAGISTELGIPDYRSPDGVWNKHTPIYYADFVRNPAFRRRYWARSLNGFPRFRDALPNAGHIALAAMDRYGRLHYPGHAERGQAAYQGRQQAACRAARREQLRAMYIVRLHRAACRDPDTS